MISFDNFVATSGVGEKLLSNNGAKEVFKFISKPEQVSTCIALSDVGLPAISGIAKSLEDKYANDSEFPLSNELNRKYTGRMIKYIMSFYGYDIKEAKDSRTRLRNFCNANYFKTSAIYERTNDGKLKLSYNSVKL